MTSFDLENLTLNQKHLESLRQHGAKIRQADGSLVELNSFFVGNAQNDCIRMGANAITYEMVLPDLPGDFLLCVHRDGFIDSGSPEAINRVLDR